MYGCLVYQLYMLNTHAPLISCQPLTVAHSAQRSIPSHLCNVLAVSPVCQIEAALGEMLHGEAQQAALVHAEFRPHVCGEFIIR
jgi:hypothetical protein